jgi:hypothetical protein
MTYQLMSYQLFVKDSALTNAAERAKAIGAAAALPRKPMRACGVYED